MHKTQKGSILPMLLALIVLAALVGILFAFRGNGTEPILRPGPVGTPPPAVPVPADPTLPVIRSILPSSGPIGTVIELKGVNLAGFEGDLDAVIENSKGETAFLPGIGSVPRTDGIIRVKIEAKECETNTGYSGLPCQKFLDIVPGAYFIYAAPWNKTSNKVQFTVSS